MAFQPPTRPHTANPRVVLSSSFFPARPSSAASNRTKSSVSSTTGKGHGHAHRPSRDHEHEWEDAWDSGSDHEDLDHPGRTQSNTGTHGNGYSSVAIPIRSQSHNRQSSGSDAVAASWASGSYQHVAHRPPLAASKTFTEGTTPPPPGTATSPKIISTSVASGSRLPPGGAWEMVEPLQEEREIEMPVKVGKEAIRENVDDILKGQPLHRGRYGTQTESHQILYSCCHLCVSRLRLQRHLRRPLPTHLPSFHSCLRMRDLPHRPLALIKSPSLRYLTPPGHRRLGAQAERTVSIGNAVYGQSVDEKSSPRY